MNRIVDLFDLLKGEDDKQKVLENVKSNISFRGANLWILACAIVVASVGLNVNSAAVIIGAMLISPLMGPIIGAGFALGIYDFPLLKKSLKNLFIATLVGLIVASLYFYISPFKDPQSELLARTSPNIYDILIAFFGGLVGVIAITRKEKGNPIPGVAIATALMPPLCTAGYGIALGNYKFLFGALFLYSINCVFICIATFLIVKYLKYPRSSQVEKTREKKITFAITVITLTMLIPSIYFAYVLYEQKKYEQRVNEFLTEEFSNKGYTIIYKNVRYKSDPSLIELAFHSKKFSKEELGQLHKRLDLYGLNNTDLRIRQDTTNLRQSILNQINSEKRKGDDKDAAINALREQIKKNSYDSDGIFKEAQIIFPDLMSLSIANHDFYADKSKVQIPVLVYTTKKELTKNDLIKFSDWLKVRLKKEQIEIFRKN